jgi:acetylornithine deacetylase/succinyl-diaminopimelate desuccinylase
MSFEKRLSSALDEGEIVGLVSDLVRIPSHKACKDRERKVAEFIFRFFGENGIDAELIPIIDERPNVIARIRGTGGGLTLMLNGHTDTVPPYGMDDPYSGAVREGRVYGRGSCDMKAGLAAMMCALVALKRADISLSGDVVFTGVIDEEFKSEGTEAVIQSNLSADYAIVGEPTELSVALGHRGLEWIDIVFEGRAAHSGNPEKGINAISKAAAFIRAVEEQLLPRLENRTHPVVGKSTLNFGTIHGGDQPSSVAGHCVLQLDRRYTPNESLAQVFKDFEDIIQDCHALDPSFKASVVRNMDNMATMDHLPVFLEEDHPLVAALVEAHERVHGKPAALSIKSGWTDASLLQNYGGIPTLNYGPGSLARAHTELEYVEIDHLKPAALVYALTAVKLCGPAAERDKKGR